jgi:hypothetical protein
VNPQLEFFLERAFESVAATSPEIGRVVVEPDYDANPSNRDAGDLAQQLRELVSGQSPDAAALASPQGYHVAIPADKPLLRKYLRSVTLHRDRVEGAWVEVAPPGNWI